MRRVVILLFGVSLLLAIPFTSSNSAQKKTKLRRATPNAVQVSALWREPTDIRTRDLFYGPGGKANEPQGDFKFIKEDPSGSNPKFDVEDRLGNKWRVKLGNEAQSETAATRLLWAVGYYADKDYYFATIHVAGLPKLKRGRKFVSSDGTVRGARLELKVKAEKSVGQWSWFSNPFVGTKELSGLKIMMALINNFDLKSSNNDIYQESDSSYRYVVTDVGASFGKTGHVLSRSRGKLKDYEKAKFISKTTPDYVDFVMHSRPPFFFVVDVPYYLKRTHIEGIPKHIPRDHARWFTGWLSQLSDRQIEDAFRAAGYSPTEVRAFANVVRRRILELSKAVAS
jgi:hypothetical protein